MPFEGMIRISIRETRVDGCAIERLITAEELLATEPEVLAMVSVAPALTMIRDAIRERKSK